MAARARTKKVNGARHSRVCISPKIPLERFGQIVFPELDMNQDRRPGPLVLVSNAAGVQSLWSSHRRMSERLSLNPVRLTCRSTARMAASIGKGSALGTLSYKWQRTLPREVPEAVQGAAPFQGA